MLSYILILLLIIILLLVIVNKRNTTIRVGVFPGAQNLPLWAAIEQGFFDNQGLNIQLSTVKNSTDLRQGLIAGQFDIAQSAVDNALVIPNAVIFMGIGTGMTELFVQPNITSIEMLRDSILLVDDINTAYALQLHKILFDKGLKPGDYQLKAI